MNRDERTTLFAEGMWDWFSRHKRELPWRDLKVKDDTQRAYQILVSEVMLQQTQVSRVQIVFKRFIEQFATIQDLAKASNKEVIMAWKGMGYNSRALRLRDAAKTIVEKHQGKFPHDLNALLSIKGIGEYTAGAIRNFAFGIPTPCVDTNIHRILHRVFEGPEPEKINAVTKKKVIGFAGETLRIALECHGERSRTMTHDTENWHASLMDFGSLVCKKNNPLCSICPLSDGICKSAFKITKKSNATTTLLSSQKKEPGRLVGGRFIPNRIFRGRIVDILREHPEGMRLDAIGKEIAIDWSNELVGWLDGLLSKLVKDELLQAKKGVYTLRD